MKSSFSTILFFLFIQLSSAQEFEREIKEAIHGKAKLDLRLDSRHSFVSESGVRVLGIKFGLQFEEKLSIGLGYNQLSSELLKNDVDWNGIPLRGQLVYRYFSPYVDYIFYQDDKWELSIPVQLGYGDTYYLNKMDVGPRQLKKKRVFSYEPAITFQYRFSKYFGAGMGVGYRLMIKGNPAIEERFTSPVYLFKFKLYFQEILNELK